MWGSWLGTVKPSQSWITDRRASTPVTAFASALAEARPEAILVAHAERDADEDRGTASPPQLPGPPKPGTGVSSLVAAATLGIERPARTPSSG